MHYAERIFIYDIYFKLNTSHHYTKLLYINIKYILHYYKKV